MEIRGKQLEINWKSIGNPLKTIGNQLEINWTAIANELHSLLQNPLKINEIPYQTLLKISFNSLPNPLEITWESIAN